MISFDSNVLVYAADRRDTRKQTVAHRLLRESAGAVLLWQVACEFIAASRKLTPHGLTTQEAWDQLDYYRRAFPITLPSPSVLDAARDLHVNRQWSFWDAMLVAARLDAGVTRLYSEDLPGQSSPPGLEIVNPFA